MSKELAILGGPRTIEEKDARFVWPIISDEMKAAVLSQMDISLSLYNRSGIFAEFEDAFAKYHGSKHALLTNSGTSALFGLYEGLGLKPGDEVICPTYTFFATVSPLLYTGATPIFCDCLENGNIDPDEIEKNITENTKAIMITHMWGIPCEMDDLIEISKKYNIPLLEDCSHAHGALYKGRVVGSFGAAAAWSLQGQKFISGGEGGIIVTNDNNIFSRALLQGHYNKRCKQEIDKKNDLYQFAVTGFGQKFRAHPLAIAIAKQQFKYIDKWRNQRHKFALKIIDKLKDFPFLIMPNIEDRNPSWYAFVIQFDPSKTRIDNNTFVEALHAEGLVEVDIPGSTGPIHGLPLFKNPEVAMPRLYSKEVKHEFSDIDFPNALSFYKNAIKIPIWSHIENEDVMNKYISGFVKVANCVMDNPDKLTRGKG